MGLRGAPDPPRPVIRPNPPFLASLPFPLPRTGVRVGAQAGAVLAGRLCGAGAGFLVVVLLTRTLPQADVGIVLTALAAAVLGEVAATLGRDAVAVQAVPQALAAGDAARASAFGRSLGRQLAWGVPVAGLAAGLSAGALTGWSASPLAMALTALVVAGMTGLRALSHLVMAAGGIALGALMLFVARPVLWLCAVAALAQADALSVEAALAAAGGASLTACALLAVLARRPLAFLSAPPSAPDPEWGRSGRQLILPTLMIGELPNVVTLCASALLAPPQVAVLGVALRIAGLVALGTRSLIAALGPRLSAAWDRDRAAAARVGRAVPLIAAPATLAVVAGVWGLAEPLLGLFGAGYAAGGWSLRVLVLMPLVTACAGPSLLVLTAAGRARDAGAAAWPTVAMLMAGSAIGAAFGTLGVAFCVVAATTAWEVLLVRRLRAATGLSLWLPFGRAFGGRGG